MGGGKAGHKTVWDCAVRVHWRLKIIVWDPTRAEHSPSPDQGAAVHWLFLHFHALPRSIWWGPDPTPGEIPGADGEPAGAQSRLRLPQKIRGFPAEVKLLWDSFLCFSLSLSFIPLMLRLGAVLNSTGAALPPRGVGSLASLPSHDSSPSLDCSSVPEILSAANSQVQIPVSRDVAHVGWAALRWRGCAGEASWLQTRRIQNGTVSSAFSVWGYESLHVLVVPLK